MANYIVEKEFEYKGMKCVVTFQKHGHRCGYVGVPKGHPLYGKDYSDYLDIKKEDMGDKEISGIFPLFSALLDDDERIRIEAYFNCHGGITYSGGGCNSSYPIPSDLWWFGFDCAHCDDGKDFILAMKLFPEYSEQIAMTRRIEEGYSNDYVIIRELNYVEDECKKLADQLIEFN